ncbi:MAG: ABC transporter ATP-binding protein [Candidatus Paceibacterota bacterium]
MKISNPNADYKLYPIKDLILDVWKHSGSGRLNLILGTFFRAAGDLVDLYPAVALGVIVSTLTAGSLNVWLVLLKVFIFWILSVVARQFFLYLAKKLIFSESIKITTIVQKKMIEILISLDSGWQENESSGKKMKRIEVGSFSYRDILSSWVNNYIEIIIRFVGIPIILFKFDPIVAGLVVLFLFIYWFISVYLRKSCIQAAYDYNLYQEESSGLAFEVISNIKTIRVLHVSDAILKKLSSKINDFASGAKRRFSAFNTRSRTMNMFSNLYRIGVVFYIIYAVLNHQYEVGFIVIFFSYFSGIIETIKELSDVSQDTIVHRQNIYRMYDLIGKELPVEKGAHNFPKKWDALSIKNLSFSYGENEAIKDLSLAVEHGQKVGIVGLSGAGKSTLFKLLIRERDDYTGSIDFGNVSFRDIKKDDFYKNVSIVPQDTEVFNFSLKENITIAKPEDEENAELLDRALTISHVKEFLHKLSLGVDTMIGEKGVKLSGGERQRLGIARAVFKQPEILLLDEATSHLDIESEEKIKDSLHLFFKDITAIVIAHRLTTIREMDKIVVIEDGRVVEAGSFDELMNKKDRFYSMWQKQKF